MPYAMKWIRRPLRIPSLKEMNTTQLLWLVHLKGVVAVQKNLRKTSSVGTVIRKDTPKPNVGLQVGVQKGRD